MIAVTYLPLFATLLFRGMPGMLLGTSTGRVGKMAERMISYEQQTLDHPNPLARFAHRRRFARSCALVLAVLRDDDVLLDYGCGQGRFLAQVHTALEAQGRRGRLYGYDPHMTAQYPGYKVVCDLGEIASGSVSVLTCLEVCEHLDDAETEALVALITRVLRPDGALLVSVPIMVGPAVLLKEACRAVLFRRWPDTTASDLLRAALWGRLPPRAENIKGSHRGYDWTATRLMIERHFDLVRVEFGPFRGLGWYGNSQAFMVCRPYGT